MKVLTYQIQLLEPVLLTGLEGDPNSSITLSYVPGSVLRGALIGQHTMSRANPTLDWDAAEDRRLFLDGSTRFLNGYVMKKHHRQLLPSLPAPLSWHRPKRAATPSDTPLCQKDERVGETVYDFAVKPIASSREHPVEYKPIVEKFCLVAETAPHLASPDNQVRVQTARHRDYGRARRSGEDDSPAGAVYQYESLQAGQTFRAHILCADQDSTTLQAMLDQTVSIGGARSNGYGRVKLHFIGVEDAEWWSELDAVSLIDEESADYAEYEEDEIANSDETTDLPNGRVVVTCLSDLLLRDKNGSFTVDPYQVGLALKLKQAPSDVYGAARAHGGFNRTWGVPLPQVMAWRMGTVFVFDNVPPNEIARLEQIAALGEQQIDGFGRIAINWHQKASFTTFPRLKPADPNPVTIGDQNGSAIAALMVERRYRQQLDRYLNEAVNNVVRIQSAKSVSKSQLYRLRLALQGSIHTVKTEQTADLSIERQKLTDYLKDLDKRSSTHRQFRRARIGGTNMLTWLNDVISATSLKFEGGKVPQLGGVRPQVGDAKMIFEYNLRYADGVLADIAKLKREVS